MTDIFVKLLIFSNRGNQLNSVVLLFVTITKQEANTTIPTTTPPCPEYLCFCSWYWDASHNRSRWRLPLQTPPGDCLTEPQPLLMRRQPVLVTSASAEPSGLKVNLLFFELGRVVFFWQIKCILHFFAAISISNIQLQPKQLIGGEIWVEGSNNEMVSTYRHTTLHPLLQCCICTNRIFWQGLGWHLLLISVTLGSNERSLTRRDYDADPGLSMTVDNQEKWFLFSLEFLNFDTMRNTHFLFVKTI